ncbi:MAG TPA: tripartite tricarboxylate transporter substrate binding protein [Burkholderiales bacterium]|nr:tripartite tricarboxylate transporter substrate binding protein [Burkholderiales bacterium]
MTIAAIRAPVASPLAGLLFALACATTNAQGYPQRAVRFIVPVAAGGATDILTRTIGQRLTAAWGQQVLVDNRPGGGSNVGFEIAAQAPADGYTLLMAQPAFTVNVSLYKKLAYDPTRDFAAVTLAATGANVLVIHPSVPAYTLKDFIALAKSKPGQMNYASSGNGTTPHLSGELFKAMAGVNITHIPYKGAGASISDLLGGHVDLAFVSLSSVVPQLKAKRLRALAITSARRTALMPELPTFTEAGLKGFEVTGWYGVVAPAGTAKEIIARLHADITRVLAQAEVVQTLASFGLEAAPPNTPEEFTAYLRAEIIKWAKVVKTSGARAD